MNQNVEEIIGLLEMLIDEDMSSKVKTQLQIILGDLKKDSSYESLIKIQEELETISNIVNLDNYVRNELMNLIPLIESIYNS